MKKLLFLFLVTLTISCQEDTEPANPTDPTGEVYETQDVQIILPEGSSVDLNGAELLSFGESFSVGSDGKTKAISTSGKGGLAYIFDKNDEPILMGFISSTQAQVSPQTTADVLLYLATTLWMTPEDFSSDFFSNLDQIPAAVEWREEFEELWKQDPLVVSKGAYKEPLQEVIKKIMPEPNELDIRAKASDIQVDQGDIKSGIQIFESDLGEISITNFYRRRAHGFAYKMSTKLTDGTTKTILSTIGAGTGPTKDFGISATAGNTSLTGTLGGIIETGGEGSAKSTLENPFDLNLAENESEAVFKVRVVGPGNNAKGAFMTDLEKIKQQRLTVETFVIDFVYPAISVIFSWKDDLKSRNIDVADPATAKFIDDYALLLNTVPGIYEKLNEGNYKDALEVFLLALYDGAGQAALGDWLESPYKFIVNQYGIDGGKLPGEIKDFNTSKFKKLAKIIQIVDTVLGAGDILLVSVHSSISEQVDEWTVTARSAKVSLLPAESTVRSRGSKEITAEIKNLQEEGGDNFPYFKWSTSGKFGIIQDRRGNKGTDFESSDKEIIYYSQTNANDLPEENNFEYVYVEAYYKNQLIGRDTTVLNLKKSSYQLKPGGLILTGKEDQTNSAKLFIEPVNQRDADFTGKKVVWSTEGKHGRLSNFQEYATVVTTYDENWINYLVTDKDTEKGTETITARIYEKSAVDGEYFLYEELTQTIEIENSENVKYLTLDLDVRSVRESAGGYISCSASVLFYLDPDPDAVSYTARVIDHNVANMIGRTFTWTNSLPPNFGDRYGLFVVFVNAAWGPDTGDYTTCDKIDEKAHQFRGKVQVRVQLKDPG